MNSLHLQQQQQQQQLLPNNNPNKSKCLIVLSERAGEEMRMNQEVESRDRNQKKNFVTTLFFALRGKKVNGKKLFLTLAVYKTELQVGHCPKYTWVTIT